MDDTVIQQEAQATTSTIVNRVTVKVPPFWNENPNVWFSQVEAQFTLAGVTTDISKFNIVVAAIESRVLAQIADAVTNPPEQDKFLNLKKQLLERFGSSEQENIQRLLSGMELGDQRPSQLLNEMKHLGGKNVTEQILQTLWMKQLPTQVNAILQATTETDLSKKAALADRIMEVTRSNVIAQTSTSTVSTGLQDQINQLTIQVQALLSEKHSRSRPRERSRRRSNSTRSTEGESVCYYHRRFGKDARTCRSPCSFSRQHSTQSKNL